MTNTTPSLATCSHYDPLPGGTSCRHALPNGLCNQPLELYCPAPTPGDDALAAGAPAAERDRPPSARPPEAEDEPASPNGRPVEAFPGVGGPQAAEPAQQAGGTAPLWRNLFGNLPPKPSAKKRPPPSPPGPSPWPPAPPLPASPALLVSVDTIVALGERFSAVQLETDEFGPLWLVAEPTGSDRLELTFRDAAALFAFHAAFPGSRVVALERAEKKST